MAAIADLTLDGRLTGSGVVNLDIDAGLVPDFGTDIDPLFNLAVDVDLAITYNFVNADTKGLQFGDDVIFDFQGTRLDLGAFFSEFVDPQVAALQDQLDFPGLKETVEFLSLFLKLGPIAEGLPGKTELGSFKVAHAKGKFVGAGSDEFNSLAKRKEATGRDLNELAGGDIRNVSQKKTTFFTTVAGHLAFPFLEDTTLIQDMLLGDTTPQLVTFGLDFSFAYIFRVGFPIIFPFLNAEFELNISASPDFDAGYDLFGANAFTNALDFSSDAALGESMMANRYRLADGLFLDDHFPTLGENPTQDEIDRLANLQDGDVDTTDPIFDIGAPDPLKERPELTLSAKISAGVSVGSDLLIASFRAGVRVFFASVGIGLFTIALADLTFELINEVVFDFDIFRLDDAAILAGVVINPPEVGAVVLDIATGDGADSVVIREAAAGNSIIVDLGAGADRLQISGDKLLATASVSRQGGAGVDTLLFDPGVFAIDPPPPPAVPIIPSQAK